MSRPDDLPAADAYEHGTRARYVTGCRCAPCTAGNTAAARERTKRRQEAAAEVKPSGPPVPGELVRGGRVHQVLRCPGANGRKCVRGGAWLRGALGVCTACVERATVWNGLVSAGRVRQHLRRLSRKGVGYKAVAEAADVSRTVLQDVMAGRKRKVRAELERRVLRVDAGAALDHALVPAARTQALIAQLRTEGFTNAELARRLGYKAPALQIGKTHVLARTELRIRRFYTAVMT